MGPYLLPHAGSSNSEAAMPPGAAVYDCFAVSNHFGGLGGENWRWDRDVTS